VGNNRGVALILALLVLSFLTIIGSAFLTTSTIDIWISDNYKTGNQSLYLAEAGIDHAREVLRVSPRSSSEVLAMLAGPDLRLATTTDADTLMAADDQPLIPSHELMDSSGRSAGYYTVWLRNDSADGMAALSDTNGVLTLLSLGRVGNSRKLIEVTVEKGRFPETSTDPQLQTVAGIEGLVARITHNATDVYTAPAIGDYGSALNYGVVVVNGNIELGSGTAYGVLLVRGEATVTGNFTWNGLLLVAGQGILRINSGVTLTVNGGLFVAGTRAADGTMLSTPAGVSYEISDVAQIKAANRPFPYSVIATREM
jgi:Tfp pilus assembly protein PilX